MSSDVERAMKYINKNYVSIPLEQGNVFRPFPYIHILFVYKSQSLWNRAMSSDEWKVQTSHKEKCLNPFGTGQCLPTLEGSGPKEADRVSIPLEQGNVFRHIEAICPGLGFGLNPFGTGQCLPTYTTGANGLLPIVSIPLEQGNVFRQTLPKQDYSSGRSQSLWNRAMSSDGGNALPEGMGISLNPFGTGQCLPTVQRIP